MKKIILCICFCLLTFVSCKTAKPDESKESPIPIQIEEKNLLVEEEPVEEIEETKTEEKVPLLRGVHKTRFSFSEIKINQLEVQDLILSPGEDARHQIRFKFSLDTNYDDLILILMDQEGYYEKRVKIENSQVMVNDVYIYEGIIEGLRSGESYNYMILHQLDASLIFTLRTLNENESHIGFFADLQGYNQAQYDGFKTQYNHMLDIQPEIELILLAGDLVDSGISLVQWSFLKSAMAGPFTEKMWASAIGNHDVYTSDDVYINTFNFPKNGLSTLENRSYYLDLPFARIAFWDTESLDTYEDQSLWLSQVMAEASHVFKIVVMHRSVYPMAYDELYIRALSEVFENAGIDLVLSGHDHIYNRTTMLQNKQVDLNEGVTYLVGGSGSGSKYYEENSKTNRYWKHLVYDLNEPIFSVIDVAYNQMSVHVYALHEGQVVLVDSFNLVNR